MQPTISDLSGMKLNKEEQAKRHAAFVSKNRVQLPETARSEAGHKQIRKPVTTSASVLIQAQVIFPSIYIWQMCYKAKQVLLYNDAPADKTYVIAGPEEVPTTDANATAMDSPDARQNSEGQEAVPDSPHVGRQRAEAATTPAPYRPNYDLNPSPPSSLHSQHALESQPQLQTASHTPTEQAYHAGSEDDCAQSADAHIEPSREASAEAVASAAESLSSREAELEVKLSELTQRLRNAEQAATQHSQLHSQLQQLKADKTALQSDLQQFMQHTSSMMTTLHSQISKLLVAAPTTSARAVAQQDHLASASRAGHREQDFCEHALHGKPSAEGHMGPTLRPASTLAAAQTRSSVQDWLLESHGDQPSPLACHEIFQRAASRMQSSRNMQGNTVQHRQRVDGLQLGLGRRQEQVTLTEAELGSGAVYTQLDEAGFSGKQNLSAGEQQKKVESHEIDSVYADEAALPSFAHMAAAQGSQLAGVPQLWSNKQSRLQLRGQVDDCSLLSDRLSAAVIRPELGLHSTEEPEPCPLPQRLTELQRSHMHVQPGRQALTEIPMPQLRQCGLPHAPMPKQGTYNGPASLRLKPMSAGLPPNQPVVNVHDSLALSAWAGAG
ncbi:TPA: hypothetical protein ACH3X1_010248 [Trebouxia sp. C0004]